MPLPTPIWMVDDEAELVAATVSMLSAEATVGVRGSTDPREVAQWLERERPGALITDVRMPNLNGLELVTRLHQRWGPVPVVVITAYPTAQVDRDARAGRFAYLPKPFSFQDLRDTLLRVSQQPTPTAFSGAIVVNMLGEVVQLYGLANRTGVLRIDGQEGAGEIHFEAGQVLDARARCPIGQELRGVPAFNALLSWKSGNFSWSGPVDTERTIHQGLSELLLEAYRLRDEADAGRTTLELDDLDAQFDALEHAPPAPRDNVLDNLRRLGRAEGFLNAALIDLQREACLASVGEGEGRRIEQLALSHTGLVSAKQRTVAQLAQGDDLEDIVVTTAREYHLVRLVRSRPGLFFFMALERSRANLAMARYLLSDIEKDVVL